MGIYLENVKVGVKCRIHGFRLKFNSASSQGQASLISYHLGKGGLYSMGSPSIKRTYYLDLSKVVIFL